MYIYICIHVSITQYPAARAVQKESLCVSHSWTMLRVLWSPSETFILLNVVFRAMLLFFFLSVLLLTESFFDFITNTGVWFCGSDFCDFLIVLYPYASNFLGCKCDSLDAWGTNCPYVWCAFVMQVMNTVWIPGIRRKIGAGCAKVTRSVIRFKSAASSLSVKLLLMHSHSFLDPSSECCSEALISFTPNKCSNRFMNYFS